MFLQRICHSPFKIGKDKVFTIFIHDDEVYCYAEGQGCHGFYGGAWCWKQELTAIERVYEKEIKAGGVRERELMRKLAMRIGIS